MHGKSTQRGGYNREVEWYLTEVSRLMGERSNFGGLVAVIERGGSGGCSGTKGCGMVRVEPFENAGRLHADAEGNRSVHGDFRRARACDATWRAIGLRSRWLLAARYSYSREKLPPGMHGQLGDLSAVALVVAMLADSDGTKTGSVEKLFQNAGTKGALKAWETKAAKELEIAHGDWDLFRVSFEEMAARGRL